MSNRRKPLNKAFMFSQRIIVMKNRDYNYIDIEEKDPASAVTVDSYTLSKSIINEINTGLENNTYYFNSRVKVNIVNLLQQLESSLVLYSETAYV